MATDVLPHTINQSQIKSWRRCPRQWKYHYKDLLEPKAKGKAITIGLWGHRALETHYTQGDWKIGYNEHLQLYKKLFKEERDALDRQAKGHLPDIVRRVLLSYLWYYRDEDIKVHIVEKSFEVVVRGVRFKGRLDWYIEDGEGRFWVGDHKFVTNIPDRGAFHAMDLQLMLYPYAIEKAWGLPIHGVMWNYVCSKPPTVPKLVYGGSRISRQKINTDYPTLKRFLIDNGLDPRDYSQVLKPLRAESPFLKRYWLPREEHVTKQIMREAVSTGRLINQAHDDQSLIVRNITRECTSMCGYMPLCRIDLEGGDTRLLISRRYQTVKEDDGYSDFAQYSRSEEGEG